MRRPRVEWMTRGDDFILEFLYNGEEEALRSTPAVITLNIPYSASTVRQRIRVLEQRGLVEYYDEEQSAYQITEKGISYLNGELDAGDLEGDEE